MVLEDEDLLEAIVEVEERVQILTIIAKQARRRGAHGIGERVEQRTTRTVTAARQL